MTRFLTSMLLMIVLGGVVVRPGKTQDLPVGQSFRVSVTLTPAARHEMLRRGEHLRVFGYFFGAPRPGVISHEGEVGLGGITDQQFGVDSVATVPAAHLNPAAMKNIQGSVELLINVVSARLTSGNNLLSCDFYEGPAPRRAGLTIPIQCGLITENLETRHLSVIPEMAQPRVP